LNFPEIRDITSKSPKKNKAKDIKPPNATPFKQARFDANLQKDGGNDLIIFWRLEVVTSFEENSLPV